MIEKPLDIDSFTDTLASMTQQSNLLRRRWSECWGTLEGKKTLNTYVHIEKEILKHLIQKKQSALS